MSALVRVTVAGDAAPWQRAGFATDDDGLTVGTTRITCDPTVEVGAGIRSWELAGDGPDTLDGLPTTWTTARPDGSPAIAVAHPNGTFALDHVVVMTPDLDRTASVLQSAGLDLRRIRETGTPERPVRQAFFWLGDVILEVVGDVPHEDPAARFWGLVAVVPDVDAVAAQLGPDLVGAPKDAVQRGRRIVTVRREAGLPVPLAFLTPHVRDDG